MTGKKQLQPLLLFSLAAVLSFATGVFIGVMITLNFMKEESSEELNNVEILSEGEPLIENLTDSKETTEVLKKENKALNRYKNMLQKSIDENSQNEEFFKNYGVVVGSYTNMQKANDIAIDLKSQYDWEIAVYIIDDFHKVIIGPFDNQTSAQQFLDQMPKISRFITAQVIEFPKE